MLEKKLNLITTFNFIVDVSATAVAFFGMVLITCYVMLCFILKQATVR